MVHHRKDGWGYNDTIKAFYEGKWEEILDGVDYVSASSDEDEPGE